MLMIIRSLDLVFCHLAWTGLFGYFIGMAALHPHSRFKLLATGYLAAATFHGLWDATSGFDSLSQLLVGLLSYCALALAILKGRKVSPDRANNFATSARRNNAPRVAGSVRLEPALLIAGKPFPIRVGQRLFAQDVPGLQPGAADGLVGEFTASPDNPARIGLTNRSATPWIKITAAGERRTVEPGKTVHLVAGATIRFTGDLPLGCEGRLQ